MAVHQHPNPSLIMKWCQKVCSLTPLIGSPAGHHQRLHPVYDSLEPDWSSIQDNRPITYHIVTKALFC